MASFISSNETHDRAQNGVVATHGCELISRVVEEALGINCGLFVCASGTEGIACEDLDAVADASKVLGVTVFEALKEDFDSTHHYGPNDIACIVKRGEIYVLAEDTVVADRPVFARVTSDAGDNTVLGKVRGDSDVVAGGIVITPDASFTAALTTVGLTLSDGVNPPQSFQFSTDATPTTAEVAAGLVAAIDASALFAATGTVDLNITSGTGIVEVVAMDERLTLTTPGRAVRIPGAFFCESRSGAGLVKIRVGQTN